MTDLFLSLFDEKVILLRTIIYTFGWTTLIISTIVLLYKTSQIKKKLKNSMFAKPMFPFLLGWIATMWSLGAVCTFYVFDLPQKGMVVTTPIFIIWVITMIVVFLITSKFINGAIKQHNETNSLNEELKKANFNLQQLDKLKSEFITIVTHQLRTPLSETKWTLDYLLGGGLGEIPQKQKETLKNIYKANDNIITMINELLDVKKGESEIWGYKFEKQPIEIIARNAVEDFYLPAKERKINLIFKKSEIMVPDISIDSKKIRMVFRVLIENAIHYSSEGNDIEIKIESAGEDIRVSIKDQGIGIPEEERSRIFSIFFRGEKALKQHTEGTGIGLYMAKNIIETHDGKIWFEPNEDGGTTFYFTIPINNE